MQEEATATTTVVAVLRDTNTGNCILTPLEYAGQIDADRLDESWLEIAGYLYNVDQYNTQADDGDCECDDAESPHICFTECEEEGCDKLLAIIDGGAPSWCATHDREDEE